jgi:hypothetical protein
MTDPSKTSGFAIGALTVGCAAVTFYAFSGALSLPYYSDDFALLRQMADYRGRGDFLGLLRLPHNEHIIPLLRALLWVSVDRAGFAAIPIRFVLLLAHAAGAVAAYRLALTVARSRFTAGLAAALYAAAAGDVGSVVWSPTSGVFLLAGTFLAWSLVAALSARPSPVSRATALAAFVLCVASLNGAAVAVVSLVCAVGFLSPASVRARLRDVVALGVTAALLLAAARFHPGTPPLPGPAITRAGLARGVWLTAVAPARFLIGLFPPYPGETAAIFGLVALAGTLLLASFFWLTRAERRLVLVLWSGPALLGVVVGLARSDLDYRLLFLKSRYYYLYLLPLALHLAFLAGRATRPAARLAIAVACAAALWGSHVRFLSEIPWPLMAAVEADVRSAERLAGQIRQAAAPGTLHLADGPIPFDSVMGHELHLSTILRTEFPQGLAGVTIEEAPVAKDDENAQNLLLDRWEPAPRVCVRGGRLTNTRSRSWIDFRRAGFDEAQLDGFWDWSPPFRWMKPRASLFVESIPGQDLVLRAGVPGPALPAEVHLTILADGRPVGAVVLNRAEPQEIRLPIRAARVRPVLIALEADRAWSLDELYPRSPNLGLVSLSVWAVGFGEDPGQKPCRAADP